MDDKMKKIIEDLMIDDFDLDLKKQFRYIFHEEYEFFKKRDPDNFNSEEWLKYKEKTLNILDNIENCVEPIKSFLHFSAYIKDIDSPQSVLQLSDMMFNSIIELTKDEVVDEINEIDYELSSEEKIRYNEWARFLAALYIYNSRLMIRDDMGDHNNNEKDNKDNFDNDLHEKMPDKLDDNIKGKA